MIIYSQKDEILSNFQSNKLTSIFISMSLEAFIRQNLRSHLRWKCFQCSQLWTHPMYSDQWKQWAEMAYPMVYVPPLKAWGYWLICWLENKSLALSKLSCVNSLKPSDARWCHGPWPIVLHYLNHCWFVISRLLHQSPECNITGNAHESNHYITFENHAFKIKAKYLMANFIIWPKAILTIWIC